MPTNIRLKSGRYIAGKDIPSGRYDILTDKSSTEIADFEVRRSNRIDSPVINWGIVGTANPETFDCAICSNVFLKDGNVLTVSATGKAASRYLMDLVDAAPIVPFHETGKKQCYRLNPGRYEVGADIPAGKYTFFSAKGTDGKAAMFAPDFERIVWNKVLGLRTGADCKGETIDLPAERGNYLMVANSSIYLIVRE